MVEHICGDPNGQCDYNCMVDRGMNSYAAMQAKITAQAELIDSLQASLAESEARVAGLLVEVNQVHVLTNDIGDQIRVFRDYEKAEANRGANNGFDENCIEIDGPYDIVTVDLE